MFSLRIVYQFQLEHVDQKTRSVNFKQLKYP